MSSLSKVNLSVPSSPNSKWGEHTASSTHVTVGTLTRSVSTRTSNSWNSGNSSTCTPGEGTVLHTSEEVDTSGLSGVLRQVIVNEGDDVLSQRSAENGWEFNLTGNGVSGGIVEY